MRVALVHDWLTDWGGAEQVLLALHRLYPEAPIYTSVYLPDHLPAAFQALDIRTSFIQKLPGAARHHRLMLPLMPLAFEMLDLRQFELVISSSHACAKGVLTGPDTLHLSYLHTPLRYAWDLMHDYQEQEQVRGLKKLLMHPVLHYLRLWDQLNTQRIDSLACNSAFIARRIQKYYRRSAQVIYPPVAIPEQAPVRQPQDFFLSVGRFVSHKRMDLIVDTFNANGLPLKMVGTGPELTALKRRAQDNIKFLGPVSDLDLKQLYLQARALIFPSFEDFGIVPVEAQAQGCPVLAFARGGAPESVLDRVTGLHFAEQTPASLQAAIDTFKKLEFDSETLYQNSLRFRESRFCQQIQDWVSAALSEHQKG